MKRAPALVALDVRRGLVSFDGAKRYGVVVKTDFTVDGPATEQLRDIIRRERLPGWEKVFDRGGTMEDIRARALEETGLKAPMYPWETLPRGPMSGQRYVQNWFEKHRVV